MGSKSKALRYAACKRLTSERKRDCVKGREGVAVLPGQERP